MFDKMDSAEENFSSMKRFLTGLYFLLCDGAGQEIQNDLMAELLSPVVKAMDRFYELEYGKESKEASNVG